MMTSIDLLWSVAFRHPRGAFHVADLPEFALKGQLVERTQGKSSENADALVEEPIGFPEGLRDFGRCAFGFGRIGDAPMCRHRLSGPDRAVLGRSIVAHREHEIELR